MKQDKTDFVLNHLLAGKKMEMKNETNDDFDDNGVPGPNFDVKKLTPEASSTTNGQKHEKKEDSKFPNNEVNQISAEVCNGGGMSEFRDPEIQGGYLKSKKKKSNVEATRVHGTKGITRDEEPLKVGETHQLKDRNSVTIEKPLLDRTSGRFSKGSPDTEHSKDENIHKKDTRVPATLTGADKIDCQQQTPRCSRSKAGGSTENDHSKNNSLDQKSDVNPDSGTTKNSYGDPESSEPGSSGTAAGQNSSKTETPRNQKVTENAADKCKVSQKVNHSRGGSPLAAPLSSQFGLLLTTAIMAFFGQMQGASGLLTESPSDVIAMTGAEVRLLCSTNLSVPVYWHRLLVGAKEKETIYFGNFGMVINGGFSIDQSRNKGSYDIIINGVKPSDAGVYSCQDNTGFGETKEMKLIVLEHLECLMPTTPDGFMGQNNFNMKEDEISASCNLRYHGNQMPRFQWRFINDTKNIDSTEVVNGTLVTSKVTIRPTKELNGNRLTFSAAVHEVPLSDDFIQWTSDPMKVLYSDLQVGTVEQCPKSEMVLVCNPDCRYSEEHTHKGQCQCAATYEVKGTRTTFTFSAYSCVETVSNQVIWIIVAAVIVTSVIAIIIAVAIIARRVRRTHNARDFPSHRNVDVGSTEEDMSNSSNSSDEPLMPAKEIPVVSIKP